MKPISHNFRPLSENESKQLDSLRGFSALAVLVGHTNQIVVAPAYDKLSPWFGLLSQSAVMVFFVMSGFLIAKSIKGNIARHDGNLLLRKYLSDRVIRIWPPLLFSVVLMALLYQLAPAVFPSGSNAFLPAERNALARQAFIFEPTQMLGAALALNDFFTDTPSSNGPLWSLSIEVWYYVLAAIIAWPRGWWKILSVPAATALFYVGWNNDQFYYYLPVWWAGYALSELHDRHWIPPAKYLRAATAAFSVAAAAFAYKSLTVADARSAWHFLVLFNVTTGLCFAAILGLLLSGAIRVPTAFAPAAAYSYTLYIVHMPLLLFAFGIFQTTIQSSTALSIVAGVSFVPAIVWISKAASRIFENRPLVRSILPVFR
ncbi:acyltransferase family protein [Cupriavidus basilensis]|uniref:acyltransferase family protein n=1 Tax=Cupriavidus basilensis TaxID=68895 RepID=UPI0005B9B074|nr:acyltransferase [Cupriavidus basilensis]